MLYPKCPQCGGSSQSAEAADLDHGIGFAGQVLHRLAHHHPVLKAAHLATKLGREAYKRVPGGGEKQCTACGHRFR